VKKLSETKKPAEELVEWTWTTCSVSSSVVEIPSVEEDDEDQVMEDEDQAEAAANISTSTEAVADSVASKIHLEKTKGNLKSQYTSTCSRIPTSSN